MAAPLRTVIIDFLLCWPDLTALPATWPRPSIALAAPPPRTASPRQWRDRGSVGEGTHEQGVWRRDGLDGGVPGEGRGFLLFPACFVHDPIEEGDNCLGSRGTALDQGG